jgi:LacI family transcriptional regulator
MSASPSPPTKRILVCSRGLSAYIEDKVQWGIRRFALNRPDWRIGHLHAAQVDAAHVRDVLGWEPDGLLVVTNPSQVPKLFELEQLPTVVTNLHHELLTGVSSVEPDNRAVGRQAAEYFLRNRFEHFGIILWPGNPPFSGLRKEGYVQRLREEAKEAHAFELKHIASQPWYRNPELEAWLQALPRPAGVYCVNDITAMRFLEHCDRMHLRVPSEISVLGTDDNHIICESIRPHISSIPQSLDDVGFRAAEILDAQIDLWRDGGRPPPVHEVIAPGEVVERQSSSLKALSDPAIAKAANYLRDHALTDGTIGGAAREGGLNRRALERGFKRHLGVTPGQYLREVKIDHAKRLLAGTDLRMSDIAEACRMTQEHFASFFRKITGETPSTYRRKCKRPQGGAAG